MLATHGYARATVAAVATEAGVAPGLVHHHFRDKDELLSMLLDEMVTTFRARVRERENGTGAPADPLTAWLDAALQRDARADTVAAKCWVGLFAEAMRAPRPFSKRRRVIDAEMDTIARRSSYELDRADAGCVLAFVVGALVLGALAPRRTAGFAAPGLHRLVEALQASPRGRGEAPRA